MIAAVERHRNRLLFTLRQRLWGRLRVRRGLPRIRETDAILRERSFYRLAIETIAPQDLRQAVDLCWDIGCRNWSYAGALAEGFPGARLLGIELDGGRRYWNLYRRMDVAQAFALELGRTSGRRVECRFGDFAKLPFESVFELSQGTGNWAFCFFFPFVSERPCRKWGLPGRYADFERLLTHARRLARESAAHATLLSAHQGNWELDLALRAYARQGLPTLTARLAPALFSGLWPSPHEVTLIRAHA